MTSTDTTRTAPDLSALVGTRAELTHRVAEGDTAAAWGNELPVLATPVLLWLSEIAAMRVLEHHLPEGWMTVGSHHDSTHQAPTLQDRDVVVTAELSAVDGQLLTFDVHAEDDTATVLVGRHTRGLVDAARFRRKLGL